jgi:hypothetical protein
MDQRVPEVFVQDEEDLGVHLVSQLDVVLLFVRSQRHPTIITIQNVRGLLLGVVAQATFPVHTQPPQ